MSVTSSVATCSATLTLLPTLDSSLAPDSPQLQEPSHYLQPNSPGHRRPSLTSSIAQEEHVGRESSIEHGMGTKIQAQAQRHRTGQRLARAQAHAQGPAQGPAQAQTRARTRAQEKALHSSSVVDGDSAVEEDTRRPILDSASAPSLCSSNQPLSTSAPSPSPAPSAPRRPSFSPTAFPTALRNLPSPPSHSPIADSLYLRRHSSGTSRIELSSRPVLTLTLPPLSSTDQTYSHDHHQQQQQPQAQQTQPLHHHHRRSSQQQPRPQPRQHWHHSQQQHHHQQHRQQKRHSHHPSDWDYDHCGYTSADGYTSMDDGYSSQGGYSSHGGFCSGPDDMRCGCDHSNPGYSSGNGSANGRRKTTPPSTPRPKSRYDRKHARQYLKNTQRIHTTYTPFSLIGHIGLILYRIIMLLNTPSPFHLVSFTHLVYLTDTAFHIFSLAWHLLRFPKLERITVIYGTWVVWIGWGLAIWLSDPDMKIHQQEHRAAYGMRFRSGIDTRGHQDDEIFLPLAPFVKKYSNWYILYMPVATFLGLLLFRRNLWGLISWEHLTRMDQIGQLKYYRAWCLSGVGAGWAVAWKFCRWWFHVPYMPLDDPTFCRYASSGKSCYELSEAAATSGVSGGLARYRTDVLEFFFWPTLFSNLIMGLILLCWWSFWTFQYQGVVWREDLKEGWAVWRTTTGGMMTGLVTDDELRKSVKDWRGIRAEYRHHKPDCRHYQPSQEQEQHLP